MSCTFVIPPSTGPKALRDLSTAFMSEKNPFEKKEGWRSAVALVLGMSECRKQELMKMEDHEVSQLLYRDKHLCETTTSSQCFRLPMFCRTW